MSRAVYVSRTTSIRHADSLRRGGWHRSGSQVAAPAHATRPASNGATSDEADRSPVCPICQRRLVILATHPGRDAEGRPQRRQLWGCPHGHATVYRVNGAFGEFDLLDDHDL